MQRFIIDDWEIRDGRKALWLPPGVRPTCWVFYNNTFALGVGSVLIITWEL